LGFTSSSERKKFQADVKNLHMYSLPLAATGSAEVTNYPSSGVQGTLRGGLIYPSGDDRLHYMRNVVWEVAKQHPKAVNSWAHSAGYDSFMRKIIIHVETATLTTTPLPRLEGRIENPRPKTVKQLQGRTLTEVRRQTVLVVTDDRDPYLAGDKKLPKKYTTNDDRDPFCTAITALIAVAKEKMDAAGLPTTTLYDLSILFNTWITPDHADEYDGDGPGAYIMNLVLNGEGLFIMSNHTSRGKKPNMGLYVGPNYWTTFADDLRYAAVHQVLRFGDKPAALKFSNVNPSADTRIVVTMRFAKTTTAGELKFDKTFGASYAALEKEDKEEKAAAAAKLKKSTGKATADGKATGKATADGKATGKAKAGGKATGKAKDDGKGTGKAKAGGMETSKGKSNDKAAKVRQRAKPRAVSAAGTTVDLTGGVQGQNWQAGSHMEHVNTNTRVTNAWTTTALKPTNNEGAPIVSGSTFSLRKRKTGAVRDYLIARVGYIKYDRNKTGDKGNSIELSWVAWVCNKSRKEDWEETDKIDIVTAAWLGGNPPYATLRFTEASKVALAHAETQWTAYITERRADIARAASQKNKSFLTADFEAADAEKPRASSTGAESRPDTHPSPAQDPTTPPPTARQYPVAGTVAVASTSPLSVFASPPPASTNYSGGNRNNHARYMAPTMGDSYSVYNNFQDACEEANNTVLGFSYATMAQQCVAVAGREGEEREQRRAKVTTDAMNDRIQTMQRQLQQKDDQQRKDYELMLHNLCSNNSGSSSNSYSNSNSNSNSNKQPKAQQAHNDQSAINQHPATPPRAPAALSHSTPQKRKQILKCLSNNKVAREIALKFLLRTYPKEAEEFIVELAAGAWSECDDPAYTPEIWADMITVNYAPVHA
jgi:hypothetical protein